MGRWEPDARGRLAAAALDLYVERGLDETTVADIAARAGVTERTFFRHFTDKREVLFVGSDGFEELFLDALAATPPGTPPLEAVAAALEGAQDFFSEERRPWSRRRGIVIAAHASLQERELHKMAHLSDSLAAALTARGTDAASARLAADAGIAVFRFAFARWIAPDETRTLVELEREGLAALRALAAS
ncbi:helix-turn-helix domain-containing protein [Galbitalea sp. SE-J8]|uniref:TetR/AcrR family transcriptional regulator n=1 Tax=Galbitalea sp. SE-J8 TaxID=3054952 RepID=UPI00259C78D4|nr:TetR/AcrR family transcriptional regulator [Galbitalea sp. SE-J8]MDM4763842.1 helix-turn-helix domain-containing protein [Galbitalea sp. SE-J8]